MPFEYFQSNSRSQRVNLSPFLSSGHRPIGSRAKIISFQPHILPEHSLVLRTLIQIYLLWLNIKLFSSPSPQVKLALWGGNLFSGFMSFWNSNHILSDEMPHFEKQWIQMIKYETRKQKAYVRILAHCQFNKYLPKGFYVSSATLQGSPSWFNPWLIWTQEP